MIDAPTRSEDILRCARSLIVKGGYNSFSYADIAEVVGIRKASIHHHFPAKADLVRTLVLQYREEAQAALAEVERAIADPRDRLAAYLGHWERCIADGTHPFCVCALLATEIPVLPEAVAAEVRAHFRGLSDWIAATLEQGVGDGRFVLTGPAPAEAETFMATVHGAMLSARAYGHAETFGAITRPMLERLTR